MSADMRPEWAQRLASERKARGWTQAHAVRTLRRVADEELPSEPQLLRMWKGWERGKHRPGPRYQNIISTAFGSVPEAIFEPVAKASRLSTDLDLSNHAASAPADVDYVLSLRANAQQLIALDTQFGGDDVARLAVRAFKTSYHRLASGLYTANVERDLQAATGELGEIAAWIAYDADEQELSRQLSQEALLVSRLAGDRNMELFELANLSMQSVHLRRPAEALRISNNVLDSRLSRRTTALFLVRRARALAQTGDKRRSLDALQRARSVISESVTNQDPQWTWWLDNSELAWHEAMSRSDLNEDNAAVDLFLLAYDLRPSHARRGRYNDLAHVLDAQLRVRTWSDAEQTFTKLLPSVHEIHSARTSNLLRRAIARLRKDSAAHPTGSIIDLADELERLL